jgi:hypothetical protein
MPDKRTIARTGARILAGIIAIGIAAGSVIAVALFPVPTHTAAVPVATVAPQPTDQQRVCPGPLLSIADDTSEVTDTSSFGRAEIVSDATGTPNTTPPTTALTTNNPFGARDGTPLVATIPMGEGSEQPPLLAASQSQTATQQYLAGFAAAACGEVVGSSWLVAGSTDIGRTSLIFLSNPTTVDATVDLTIYSEAGEVSAPRATGIRVGPGSQRVIPLAGLAPNLKSPVVRVTTRGGQILASLQHSVVRGITPGGVELVGPTATPATSQTIAGVDIQATRSAPDNSTDTGYDDSQPALRLLSTGELPATTTISIRGEAGNPSGDSLSITTEAGIVTEVPLASVGQGTFTIQLESDQPIVAAARTTITGLTSGDFAWSTASNELDGDFLLSIAPGPSPVLHFVNVSASETTVALMSRSGQTSSVTVSSHGAVGVAVVAGEKYTVSGGHDLVAAVTYRGEGKSSAFAISPANPLAAPLTVYPG